MSSAPPILEAIEVSKNFAGIQALQGVSVSVQKGTVHGLIGTNGSGKSTFFNLVSGTLPLSQGRIFLKGKDISGLDAFRISRLGISRTFQAGTIVPTLTCLENVLLGFSPHLNFQLVKGLLSLALSRHKREAQLRQRAQELLVEVGLGDRANDYARNLIWVQRQKLQIARAIASDPELLLLDEPTAGMGPEETHEIEGIVRKVNSKGVTIMLVSHDVSLMSRLSNLMTVLMSGRLICVGTPEEVFNNPVVRGAYLGH